jgi:hypothetical protein
MHDIFVLFNVHFVVFDEDNGALVVVLAAVVWRAKNCDHRRECLVTSPSVHLVAVYLNLMGADNGDEVVCAQDFLHGVETELDTAFALGVRTEAHLSRVAVVHWIRPEQIAEEALKRWLNESIDGLDVRLGLKLW